MRLEGIHHITAITGDAAANVEFYAGVLGLRMVKKTVNQDDPTVYHLFYADENGDAGSDLTFFEYPHVAPGRAGAGMVHRIVWRVGSEAALTFWEKRLGNARRHDGGLRFSDPEGLEHELRVAGVADPPLVAEHPEVPADLALQGFDAAHAYALDPERSRGFLEALAFTTHGENEFEARGDLRGGRYVYDVTAQTGRLGAGTVHHIAWASPMEEHEAWRARVLEAGGHPTPVIDRFYFRSIYFREPSGVLFEIATLGPGFTADEPLETLGERLSLPPFLEDRRAEIEPRLTPLPDPRAARTTGSPAP